MKAIFFDLDGTLLFLREPIEATYRRFGVDVQDISVYWDNRVYLREDFDYKTTPEIETQYWINFATKVCNGDEEKALKIYNYYARGESRIPNLKLLERFKDETLGVFTNNDRRSHSVLEELGLAKYFRWIITAGELGVKKPSHEVFNRLRDLTGFSDLTYIGNSLELDIEPAKKAGWSTIFAPDYNENI